MPKPNKKKICIVASSLGRGGAEKSSAMLSIMLSELGYEVYIVTVLNYIDYEYKGTLLNLGELKPKKDTAFDRMNRLKFFKNFIDAHHIDVIIDARVRIRPYLEIIVKNFIYKKPVLYVIHNYKTKKAFTPYACLNKFLYKNETMITVSKAAEEKFRTLFQLNTITTVYNAFDFEAIETASKQSIDFIIGPYIIFYGRLDDEHKNLRLLFDAYKLSGLPEKNIKLLVLGNGPDEVKLKDYALRMKLENSIVFKGFEKNPYPYVKQSLFLVLSSRYEGFPMVIPEALSLNVPVVSVDCKSGPNEVIYNAHNGLLVENHNPEALAKAMRRFCEDEDLFLNCKSNAKASVAQFSKSKIAQQWQHLLNS